MGNECLAGSQHVSVELIEFCRRFYISLFSISRFYDQARYTHIGSSWYHCTGMYIWQGRLLFAVFDLFIGITIYIIAYINYLSTQKFPAPAQLSSSPVSSPFFLSQVKKTHLVTQRTPCRPETLQRRSPCEQDRRGLSVTFPNYKNNSISMMVFDPLVFLLSLAHTMESGSIACINCGAVHENVETTAR